MSKKLIFFGTEDFSATSLRALLDGEYEIAAVVTKPDAKAGRGQKLSLSKVKQLAQQADIRLFQPEKVADINEQLASLEVDYAVLVAYGKIIPSSTLGIFAGGIINLHPSLLPKYRGPSPIETAILNGDEKTGVSLIKLTSGMDEGPIYVQKVVDILPDANRLSLSAFLSKIGSELLVDKLPDILSGNLEPKPQDNSAATYCNLLSKQDGLVDWSEPAVTIERKIRAFLGYPRSRTKLHDKDVIITRARVADDKQNGSLVVGCNPGWLEILELIAPSGRSISGADFLRGYGEN
ncbi:MAG TPA: methionyl-tRNA formyltransferase [Candidatus Binatia bacterium]|nr:methionyl-tRNA formyltransferase [Candidatus Binatia bacterium]